MNGQILKQLLLWAQWIDGCGFIMWVDGFELMEVVRWMWAQGWELMGMGWQCRLIGHGCGLMSVGQWSNVDGV